MPPFENRHIIAVFASGMDVVVGMVNRIGCAHLVLHIVPNDEQAGAFWMICKKDSWLIEKLKAENAIVKY